MGSSDESGFQFCRPPERFGPAQASSPSQALRSPQVYSPPQAFRSPQASQVPLVAGGEGSIVAAGWVFVAVLVVGLGSFFVSLVTEPSEMSFANIEETRAAVEESRLPPFPYAEKGLREGGQEDPNSRAVEPSATDEDFKDGLRRVVSAAEVAVKQVRAAYEANIARLMKTIGADVGLCLGCNARVYWVTTRKGKKAPFTAAALSHFADCPDAAKYRRR